MSREIRRVPADWVHPTKRADDVRGITFAPMFDAPRNYQQEMAEWLAEKAAWDRGVFPEYASAEDRVRAYDEWAGEAPVSWRYMPDWPAEARTHFQMYEATTEGTPISPVFATPEEVARWCADNGVSVFGRTTATYEEWLFIAHGGYVPQAVSINGGPLVAGPSAVLSALGRTV